MNAHMEKITDEIRSTLDDLDSDAVSQLLVLIADADRVFVSGAGRSGFMMRCFAMRLMHLEKEVYVVGETVTPGIMAGDTLLIGSGSGATASLVNTARKARSIGARIGLITIDVESPTAEVSDVVLPIPAPSPKVKGSVRVASVQPMGSLFEQCLLLVLDALVMALQEQTGQDSNQMFTRHANLE